MRLPVFFVSLIYVLLALLPIVSVRHPKLGQLTFLEPLVHEEVPHDPIALPKDRVRSLRLFESGRFSEAAALLVRIARENEASTADLLNLAGALMQSPSQRDSSLKILRFLLDEFDEPAAAFYLAQLLHDDAAASAKLICQAARVIRADSKPTRETAPILRMLLENGVTQLHPSCPNNCSFRGVCLPACICKCDDGYEGLACELESTDPPLMKEPRQITVQFDGPIYGDGSFAHVNRKLVGALLQPSMRKHVRVFVNPTDRPPKEANPWTVGDQDLDVIVKECVGMRNRIDKADFTLRHSWPPNLNPPAAGRWVLFLPWEYCALPSDWVDVIRRRVDLVMVPSHSVRDCIVGHDIDPERVVVLPLGAVDSLEARSSHRREDKPSSPHLLFQRKSAIQTPIPGLSASKQFHFLYVGGTIHRKGIDLLLDAYLASFNASDPVTLLIKDTGTTSHYKGQTLDRQIQAQIQAAGKSAPQILYTSIEITPQQMQHLYEWAHALIHPYRGEGFGLPIAEAMAFGAAVVAPSLGPARDYVDPHRGYLIRASHFSYPAAQVGPWATAQTPTGIQPDLQDLRDTLRRLVEHPVEMSQAGLNAWDHARSRMTWAHTAEAFAALLRLNGALSVKRHSLGGFARRHHDAAFFPVVQ